jgi:resuscitation-promoting factor RpfA
MPDPATPSRPWRLRGLLAIASVATLTAATAAPPLFESEPATAPASADTPGVNDPDHLSMVAAMEGAVQLAPEPIETPPAHVLEDAMPVTPARTIWDDLADCESGQWKRDGGFVEGSADWSSSVHRTFQGGLQFHPTTWAWLKDDDMPAKAYDATRDEQIEVAERVLEAQGWEAWPVCSRKLGLR